MRSAGSPTGFGYGLAMNDTSRTLRYALGDLCERYNKMVADKDVLDFRLGSDEPYGQTIRDVDAQEAYLTESRDTSGELRTVIVEMTEIGRRIREIEGF